MVKKGDKIVIPPELKKCYKENRATGCKFDKSICCFPVDSMCVPGKSITIRHVEKEKGDSYYRVTDNDGYIYASHCFNLIQNQDEDNQI